jgi:hypothetical protein
VLRKSSVNAMPFVSWPIGSSQLRPLEAVYATNPSVWKQLSSLQEKTNLLELDEEAWPHARLGFFNVLTSPDVGLHVVFDCMVSC